MAGAKSCRTIGGMQMERFGKVKQVAAWVPPSLKVKVEEQALSEGHSVSSYIRHLLLRTLEDQPDKRE